MTSNDAQIDVLLRRYAGRSPDSSPTEHLDPDELSAFAEGAIPEAARTRYVSHLVDCDNCRQIVAQLANSSGTVTAAAAAPAIAGSGYSWWKRLAGFLSPMTLRYAAFAMVLIAVAGVVLLVTRRPRESNLVAHSDSAQPAPQSAVKAPSGNATAPDAGTLQAEANNNKTLNTNTPALRPTPIDEIAKLDQPRTIDSAVSPPKAAKEGDVTTSPGSGVSKKGESPATEPAPSYAPPPPAVAAERQQQPDYRQQQNNVGGNQASGPRKSGPADQFKMMDRPGRAGEAGKDVAADDKSVVASNRAPASKRAGNERLKGPRRDLENNTSNNASNTASLSRNEDETRSRNAQAIVTQSPVQVTQSSVREEKPSDTRSAGGRKFRRQGNGWVDSKFKSSMTLKSISRGSSEFDELDSGLRSIAQQIGGQVIVVWKNKAYLIK
jgi:hypothetical protein